MDKDRFDGCWWRSAQTGGETWLQPRTRREPTLEACFAQQLADFAARMRGEDAPMVSAERAASTIGLIEWAYRSRTTGQNGRAGDAQRSIAEADTGGPAHGSGDVARTTQAQRPHDTGTVDRGDAEETHTARAQRPTVQAPTVQAPMAHTHLSAEKNPVSVTDEPPRLSPVDEPPALPPGRVCVTGATGFIGSHLVERLGRTGEHQLVAPVRSYRTCAQIARFPVSMPRCDLLDYDQVRSVVAGARFVFHLAYGRDGAQPERVTIEGTRNVVEAAIATGSEAVVVLSTVYVFGQPPGEVDEASPYRPIGGVYGTSKALMERWCLRRAQSSPRTRIIILIPSCVYGPDGDTYTALPVRLANDAGFCWIDDGRGAANYTYVENLVDAMLLGATSAQARGRRFIINDGTSTWRSFLGQLLADKVGDMPSYTRAQLRDLHRHRRRPNLVDVARIAMADQSVRTALRETRLGEAALWGAEHATPGVMARMRRGWHANPRRHARVAEPPDATAREAGPPAGLPPIWLSDVFGPAPTIFRADVAHQVLGWVPKVGLDEGMRASRAWVEANVEADR